jgi:type IV pilus assembly protein PilV
MRRRDGFTMVELLIAIIVICVGLLGLATGAMGVLRQTRWGTQSALASIVAQRRMEIIRSKGCSSLSSGTATTRGLSENWVLTVINGRAQAVVESVSYVPREGVTRWVELKSVIPCA